MKKLLFLVVILVAAVGAGVLSIDHLVKVGVEKGGTYALGTNTTVGSTSVGLTSGQVKFTDLGIANPPGFSAEPFFSMKNMETEIPISKLTGDKIEIPKLVLSGIRLRIEQGATGANYQAITNSLKRFETTGQKEQAPGKKYVIKDLTISDVTVVVDAPLIGKTPVALPNIHMQDVGSDGSGIDLGAMAGLVVKSLLGSVASLPGNLLPADLAKDLGGQLGQLQGLGANGVKLLEGVGGQLGTQINNVGKDPASLIKGVGDLFGGKK